MRADSGGRLGVRWWGAAASWPLWLACAGAAGPAGGASSGPTPNGAGEAAGGGQTAAGSGGLEAQFQREADPIQKHVVRGGNAFTAYIEGKAPPKVERKGQAWSVTTDVGWGGSEVQCFVYDEVIDAGTAAHSMLKAAAKDVTFKGLGPYFLDHFGLDPMIGIRGVYHVVRNGTTLAGDFKLAVLSRSDRPVMCWHDAPGYAQSFARLTVEFAKSFQYKSDTPTPARGELWTISLDGTPIGFSRDVFYAMEDGGVRKVTLGARFLPTAPGEMSFDDDAEITTLDKSGTLTSGRFISIENGESSLTIDIDVLDFSLFIFCTPIFVAGWFTSA